MSASSKAIHLPWHQAQNYWLVVSAVEPSALLASHGFTRVMGEKNYWLKEVGAQWPAEWEKLKSLLEGNKLYDHAEAGLIASDSKPDVQQLLYACKPAAKLDQLADSMWLGDALLEGRVLCYLQPVVDGKQKVFGYESFARVRATDGTIIGGARIVEAAKALNIEYAIDRHLHVEAIRTFVSSDFSGFLFVNFFPGFIHRPAVYLEGLSDTAKQFGVISKYIVLDFTNAENSHDAAHVKSVCEYGRSKGYAVALDDINTVEAAKRLVGEVKPDFVKLDMKLVRQYEDRKVHDTLLRITQLAQDAGASVIAEGVETEAMFNALKAINVNLFQGYLFSPPVAVEIVRKNNAPKTA